MSECVSVCVCVCVCVCFLYEVHVNCKPPQNVSHDTRNLRMTTRLGEAAKHAQVGIAQFAGPWSLMKKIAPAAMSVRMHAASPTPHNI